MSLMTIKKKGTINMENTLFAESFSKCQNLINVMLEYKNEDGVCMVSQTELAKRLSLSQSNIGNAIKKINVEDLCVEMICPEMYVIHYINLLERGTFSCIWNLLLDAAQNYELVFERDDSIAERYGFQLKTVQMFKAYVKTGWLKYVT